MEHINELSIIGDEPVTFSIVQQWKQFKLTPQKDMTPYELALLLSWMRVTVSEDLLENAPPEMKRHFVEA